MVAVVEVNAGQGGKRRKATDEEGQRPPEQQLVTAPRKHRQPTPDHPPYCWMIGEAIDALGEDGGSEEDSISAFIRARHPGVPAAHDRLLRHYLGKHVAEGFFVRTAAGRYERSPGDDTDVDLPVEQPAAGSSQPACVGSPVVEAKRGRGRPRKDVSSPTSPAGKKDGSSGDQLTTPNRGQPDRSRAASSTPKRATPHSVHMSLVAAGDKDDEIQAPSLTAKRRGRLPKQGMATATDSSGQALVAGKKDGGEVSYTWDKGHETPGALALVIVGDSSATASIVDKACTEVPPTTPLVDGGQPLHLALVTTTEVPVPAPEPTPAMDPKKGGGEPSRRPCKLALTAAADGSVPVPVLVADKKDGLEETPPSASYKHVRQPRKAGGKALSATPKGCRRQCRPAAVATDDFSALTPGNKVGVKVSFASPKLTPVITGGRPTPASVADQGGIQASATVGRHNQPRKLYPVNADEISDDMEIVLLALPSQPLAP